MTDADSDAAERSADDAAPPVSVESGAASVRVTDPSDAFQALGNEIRTEILETVRALLEEDSTDSRVAFSTLFEASPVETTAGFAYHIDELVGPYLDKNEDGYALTYAGRSVARNIESGAYTRHVTQPAIDIDDPCPFCEGTGLRAITTDNVVTIACADCDRPVLRMDFPPTGFEAHGQDLPAAFDRHHRHRIALLGDGVCPECSGEVDATVAVVPPERIDGDLASGDGVPDPVQASFGCRQCGYDLQCPVALTLLDHPEVVAFYRDHGQSVAARPIWNVGREWSETALSHEPIAVRVAVTLDDETLECYVDETCSVVGTRRVCDEEQVVSAGTDETTQAAETSTESEPAAEADVA